MKFTDQNMDFEIPEAQLGNYFFGNLIMSKSTLRSFDFPASLGTEDFKLQLMTFDKVAMTYSFADALTLDNTYKHTRGYFESYDFASDLDEGFYRIIAGSYWSKTLLDVRTITLLQDDFYNFVDNNGNTFVDNNSNNFGQPI